jgi:hypothetical protein
MSQSVRGQEIPHASDGLLIKKQMTPLTGPGGLMRRSLFYPLVISGALLIAQSLGVAQDQFRGGIVYGPKAAFNIAAPDGWVLDNRAGAEQGLPCVLYPKGESWADARIVIYAKIAGTQFEDAETFVAFAIREMEKQHGKPKEKIANGRTKDGHAWFINEYPATAIYSQWERVAYVQLPKAVAYIVLSSRDESSYRKDADALQKVLGTFVYLEPKKLRKR